MIQIVKLKYDNLQYLNKCDEEFEIASEYSIEFRNNNFFLTEIPVIPYFKKYESEKVDTKKFLNGNDCIVYFGFYRNELGGQVILKKNWNNYAWLEIAVKQKFRRKGIGKRLIETSVNWCKEKNFPGIMIETQNNNVSACKFYNSCGFELGGFDKNFYKGIDPKNGETALFWYLKI